MVRRGGGMIYGNNNNVRVLTYNKWKIDRQHSKRACGMRTELFNIRLFSFYFCPTFFLFSGGVGLRRRLCLSERREEYKEGAIMKGAVLDVVCGE